MFILFDNTNICGIPRSQ